MATVLARTVCLGFFLPGVGALREAMEAADINLDSDRCGGLRCFRAWDSGRLNQGRFQLRAGAAQRVSWRLVPEASYSLQKDSGCNGDAETVVSSVQVLPWIHAEEPINGSTIEIFVPSVEDLVLRMNVKQNVFLCASRTFRQERSCLCQLDLIKSPSVGLLPQLGRLLPGKGFAQLAEVQVSLDRQCPAPWIPDVVVATVLALFAVFLLLSLEAAVAIKRAGPAENPRKLAEDAGLVVAKPLNLARKAGTGAVGFVTLMATTQGIAVTKAMDAQVPEAVVWLLVASAGLLSALAVWRSFQSTCQIQLSEAYLLNGQCIRNTPSVKSMDYALGAGILLYALAAAGGVLAAGTSAEQVGFMVLVLTALVGPVMNLLLRVKAGSDAETEAARVKMQPSGFEALLSRGSIAEKSTEGNFSWSFLHWEEVLAAGRQSRETRPETPGDEGIPSEGTPFGLLSDVLWQRQRIHKLTSSHAGFLVWPGCFFSLALAVASTAMQGMLFACSRGELASLEVTGLGQSIQFVKSQEWQFASYHGVCQACPDGAICDGGATLPYSAEGHWTPDRLEFWSCFPFHACLRGDADSPNLCEETRDADSIRCGQCHTDAYAHQSECYECRTPDVLIAWLGPFLYPLLMIFGFLPPLIRSLRSMDMDHTKKARRLIRTEKHTSWLGRLAESDHGEFRMIIIMITCLQTLWIVSLMPLPYTRFTQDWLWALGIVAWDLSIFRPQCAFRLSYFMKWFLQWFTFFVMVAILALLMLLYCHSHKNRNHDLGYIRPKRGFLGVVSCTLMLLLLVHLRDDLVFVGCIPCENEKWCLAYQPVIECATTNWEWTTMTVLSILDLLLVILFSIPIIAICILKSWRWQHGDTVGLDPDFSAPWYIFFSEFWVKRHRGYIQEVRQAVPEFQLIFRDDQEAAEMHQELWQRAIDLILAQEAEKAELLLIRVIRHLYAHSPRFKVIDEDEGPTFQIIRGLRDYIVGSSMPPTNHFGTGLTLGLLPPIEENRNEIPPEEDEPQPPETEPPDEKITRLDDPESDESPAKITRLDDEESQFSDIVTESLAVPAGGEVPPEPQPARPDGPDPEEPEVNPPPDDPIPQPPDDPPLPQLPREHLKVSDVHHVTLTLENLLDYAKWSIPGARAFKRVLSYSWCFILLLTRFAVIIYAMLMRRDLAGLPLVYMLITLGYVILEATLQPYVWTYLNDWEVTVHVLIYVFLLFVISGWSDTASEVLVVVATLAAIIPVILRFLILFLGEEDTEDPTDMSIARGVASYHLHQLTDGGGTVSLGVSSTSSASTTSSVSTVGGGMEHVRKYIELVKKRHITVVEKTLDDSGQEVERTTHTEEVETEGVTYSFDMTKSEVFKVMQGEKDQKPRPDQGGDDAGDTHQISADQEGLIPLTDLDVQSEVLSDDEEIHATAV